MDASQIFRKTMPFVWAKLMLGLLTVGISAVLFAILMGLGWLFNSGGVTGIMLIIWIAATGVVRFVLMHYMGYLVKAGHVAVITETIDAGEVPANQVAYGKQLVRERFAESNIYFAVDQLVTGAVKQIQSAVDKLGGALDFIPGMDAVTGVAKFFISISLGYIDECCLGYTFLKKEQGAFKSAADGVVIYAQNWKKLLKDAAKTTALVIAAMIAVVLAVFIVLGLLFRLLNLSGVAAFIIACIIAWTIKFAFIDSYILSRMMVSYMEVAPTTQITIDLYSKLCGVSAKFKQLFEKGQAEQSETARPAYAEASGTSAFKSASIITEGFVFCGQCGAKNKTGTKFCGSCGAELNKGVE